MVKLSIERLLTYRTENVATYPGFQYCHKNRPRIGKAFAGWLWSAALERSGMTSEFVILGALGDLAMRHLLPALLHLQRQHLLPLPFHAVGVDREVINNEVYRTRLADKLIHQVPKVDYADLSRLLERFEYFPARLEDSNCLRSILAGVPLIAYMALPPSVYPQAACALKQAQIAKESNIVVEKPFGEDLASAQSLTRQLQTIVNELNIYRVDHFLHHQIVHDLISFRFENPLFEQLWNRDWVEQVDITWEELSGVSDRAAFYDRTGALRDMVQSHLLQLLALVAMERPLEFDANHLRNAKAAVLSAVRPPRAEEMTRKSARGRYGPGKISGWSTKGYVAEASVDVARCTETYAYVQLSVDTPRWRGIPFVLRTGKALGHPRRNIALRFRKPAKWPVQSPPTELKFEMAPDRITLSGQTAAPAGLPALAPVALKASRPKQLLPASARMLRDVLMGNPMFAVREDEIEHSWRIVDSILAVWKKGTPPLQEYAAGSSGPKLPKIHHEQA